MTHAASSKEKLFAPDFLKSKKRYGPLHARVRERLREIIQNEFSHGDKFISEPELIQLMGVSQSTIRRALLDLTSEGLLIRKVPAGTFVNKIDYGFPSIGIFIPQYDDTGAPSVLKNIMSACRKKNLSVVLHYTHRNEQIAEALANIEGGVAENRFILLFNSPRGTRDLYRHLTKRGFHTVNVDSMIENYPGDFVGVDNAQGIRLGLSHLHELGHRRITFMVNESLEMGAIKVRLNEFQKEARRLKLQTEVVDCQAKPWSSAFNAAYNNMESVWETPNRPTAIMTSSDAGGWAVLKWFAERGIRIPDEVSVLGFDGRLFNRFVYPHLTSVAQPWEEMANRAVDMLIDPSEKPHACLCEPSLALGQSTGPSSQ